MGLLTDHIPEGERLHLGSYLVDENAIAVADGDRFFQRHAAMLGSTGSGKSWAVSFILERANGLPHSNIIVFDIHGEYRPLAQVDGGYAQYYKIAGAGDLGKEHQDVFYLPYWLLNREEMLALFVDRSEQSAPNQIARLCEHMRNLKGQRLEAEGKLEVLATYTVDSPIPYEFKDLIRLLTEDDTEKVPGEKGPKNGEWNGKLTRLIGRLVAKSEDRRYGFLFKPPSETLSYDWLSLQAVNFLSASAEVNGIKIVDFSEVPSDVLPIVTGVFARLLYSIQFWMPSIYSIQFWMPSNSRHPVAFVCDEAHLYIPVKENSDVLAERALDVFERIAKEGRKYGVALVVVSQRPSDVNRTVLSQCNNFIVLRLMNEHDQHDQNVVKRLMPDSMAGLAETIPLLDVGEALLLGDAMLLPTRIKLSLPEIKPSSMTREFWTEWRQSANEPASIVSGVEAIRRQSRSNGCEA